MTNFEKVEAILTKYRRWVLEVANRQNQLDFNKALDGYCDQEDVASQICKLFEKADEDRLLTDEEILASWGSHPTTGTVGIYHNIAKVQDAKTARIKDAESQAKVKRIFEEIESSSVTVSRNNDDTGEMLLTICETDLQALKKREGV